MDFTTSAPAALHANHLCCQYQSSLQSGMIEFGLKARLWIIVFLSMLSLRNRSHARSVVGSVSHMTNECWLTICPKVRTYWEFTRFTESTQWNSLRLDFYHAIVIHRQLNYEESLVGAYAPTINLAVAANRICAIKTRFRQVLNSPKCWNMRTLIEKHKKQ